MSVPVLGLPNTTQFNKGMLRGRRTSFPAAASIGATVASKTFISTVPANTVALIDRIDITAVMAAGATTYTLTLTTNAQTVEFAARGTAAVGTTRRMTIEPRGNMVILDGKSLTVAASAGNVFFLQVHYRLMNKIEAITGGYLPGEPFWGSVSTGAPTDVIATATVTSVRGLDIRGIAITGTQTNAAAGGNTKEILLEFKDPGAATHRKLIKNTYAIANVQAQQDLIISRGRFRGPKGYGLRATFGEAANARAAVWGFFYTDNQKTWPGTGVLPAAATDPFDAGQYWWVYYETVPAAVPNIFPTTTVSKLSNTAVIDGWACSMAGDAGDGTIAYLCDSSTTPGTEKPYIVPTALNCNGGAGGTTDVREDLGLQVPINANLAIRAGALLTDVDKMGITVWGRFMGSGLSTGYTTDTYVEAS